MSDREARINSLRIIDEIYWMLLRQNSGRRREAAR